MTDAYYCDDYEAITGRKPGEPIETKVIEAPEKPQSDSSDVKVETK